MSSNLYYIEINNDYLGKYRRVSGRSQREVELKASEQIQRWSQQEYRARMREAVADAKESARAATDAARGNIQDYQNLLNRTLQIDDRINWMSLSNNRPFQAPEPTLAESLLRLSVPPEKKFIEFFSKQTRDRRREAEENARIDHQDQVHQWQSERARYEQERRQRNAEIESFRLAYESGDSDAVERYSSLVLSASALPEGLERDCTVSYDPSDRTLIVEAQIPTRDEMPRAIEYRYIASRQEIDTKYMKDKEADTLYEETLIQIALRTIHEVLEGDYAAWCQLVVFNGVINSFDKATGREFDACIISLQASRSEFMQIDLSRIDPRACFRSLKGLSGSRIADMQPVRPIRSMNTDDARFIEADGVLQELEHDQNLMTMPWQDFEVLVRDLFESMFSSREAQVKVTRTSRDQGVDAVVFDPDPLMGGKIVIQAKRYRGTVPVAAVRELYGTMLNEGAGKGIIVTTSHYGATAREFAKDKPLTLIDGANLLHLMQKQGRKVKIDLAETSEDSLLE